MNDAASPGHPDLCACAGFDFWYESPSGHLICRCGHANWDHINLMGSCTGEVEVR